MGGSNEDSTQVWRKNKDNVNFKTKTNYNFIQPFSPCAQHIVSHLHNDDIKVVPDSGSSGHYLTVKCATIHKWIAKHPIAVRLPNKQVITNTHETFVPIPGLPESARLALIFPQLTSASLLSIAQLCDAGCKAVFDKDTVKIIKDGKILLTGYRNFINNLWEITLGSKKTPPPQIHNTKHDYSLYNVFKMSGLSSIIN